jgi:hypothetical protein
MWKGPWWFDGDHLRQKNLEPADGVVITGFRTALVALGAGVIAGLGLYYTHRSHQTTERLFEHTREKDREQSELTREGQVTERYVEAIKLLASENLTQRLGGVYSLERIMRDSEKDHATVVEVLAAFVRQHSPVDPDVKSEPPESASRPADDVQAALTVIGRRPQREEAFRIDLRRVDVRGADLADARLDDADLTEAHLERANLSRAHLARAQLKRAHLEHANLHAAQLTRAQLKYAYLESAGLADAWLEDATLDGAHLNQAWMVRATLDQASLRDASLKDTYLRKVDLSTTFGLTVEQLLEASIYNLTKLPPDLAEDARIKGRIAEFGHPRHGLSVPRTLPPSQ